MSRLLIRGGTVVDTRPQVRARPGTDVLVEDGRIAGVGPDLDPVGSEVLDATGCVVVPGFVDAHRHGWQSVLRGAAPDVDLGGYLDMVARRLGPALNPDDVAIAAELTGLECLDAGITTVLDHAHVVYGPAHADAVVAGLRASGVRAILAYGEPVGGPRLEPFDVRRLRAELADDAALVTMMLAPAGPSYAPAGDVLADWRMAADLGLRISVHVGAGPVTPTPIARLKELGVLAEQTVYVHGNSLPDDELALIGVSGGALAITPAVEARMGHGAPTLPRVRRLGVPAALGVDVVTTVPGDLFSVMRAALLTADTAGERVPVADALALATAGGAAALGMGDRIGALERGTAADIVMVRADTVSTAGSHDPVALAVAAHPGLVDTVLVGGRVVKHDGRLVGERAPAVVAAAAEAAARLGQSTDATSDRRSRPIR